MVCIHCGGKTQISNSRAQKRANRVWRRRQCLNCQAVFTTQETALYSAAWAVHGDNGSLAPFSRDKLFLSLYSSCKHRKTALKDAAGLTDTIILKLSGHVKDGVIDKLAITQVVQVALNRFDGAASVAYSAFHSS